MSAPLDKLHDFYRPDPPPWTPHTIGWYVVFALAGLLLLWVIAYRIRRRLANRYRREALRELVQLQPDQFSALLKRTALSVWPRERVAALSGDAWLTFLDESERDEDFRRAPGNRIEKVALSPTELPPGETEQLRALAARWIRRHHVQT